MNLISYFNITMFNDVVLNNILRLKINYVIKFRYLLHIFEINKLLQYVFVQCNDCAFIRMQLKLIVLKTLILKS